MRTFVFLSALLVALSAFAQDAPPPPPKPWNSSLGAGVAVTSGNSDTQNINFAWSTVYDPKTVRIFKADAIYLLGETNGEKQVDKASANAKYERTISDRTFWFTEASYLRDPFKSIDYLISPTAGVGYYIIKDETRKLAVDAGAGFAFESNTGLGSDTSAAFRAGQSWDWTISPNSKLQQRLTGLWKADDFDDALYHFDVGLATTVARRAEVKFSYVLDYKNQPPVPGVKKGDSALFATLLFKY